MRGMFRNLRGFSQLDRRRQLIDFIRTKKVDFVGLQETICTTLLSVELSVLGGSMDFRWDWLLSCGRSSGILLGTIKETFEVIRFFHGELFVGAKVIQRNNGFSLELVVVYGHADHARS